MARLLRHENETCRIDLKFVLADMLTIAVS